MKKLLVLFVAVAATISSFAATSVIYFNRPQFQWSKYPAFVAALDDEYDVQLTVPFVYTGSVAFKTDWAYEPAQNTLKMTERQNAKCLILSKKASMPAVMTLCQPCIDCYPCDVLDIAEANGAPKDGIKAKANTAYTGITPDTNLFGQPGWITTWNLYLVTRIYKDEITGLKTVDIAKINLCDDANKGTFFTGAKGKNVYLKVLSENAQAQMQLTGAKSDYTFRFHENYLTKDNGWDEDFDDDVQVAYIKSAKALTGTIYFNRFTPTDDTTQADPQVEILDVTGTVKLTRNASLTGKAILGSFASEVAKPGKGWDDCTIVADAATCEEYFAGVFEDAYFGVAYKKYELNIEEYAAEELFAEVYDVEYNFVGFNGKEEEEEEQP